MGEAKEARKTALAQASADVMVAQTMGGRMHVRWDETTQATPHGQLVFFAEFLATAGVFDRWACACPLVYSSPTPAANATCWAPSCWASWPAAAVTHTLPVCVATR